jgi:hypothetical protein
MYAHMIRELFFNLTIEPTRSSLAAQGPQEYLEAQSPWGHAVSLELVSTVTSFTCWDRWEHEH